MAATLIPNHEKALVYQVNDIDRLRRFLCFGSENGTYYIRNDYVGPEDLGKQNVECVQRLLSNGNGLSIIEELRSFSKEGRTPNKRSMLLVLAICAKCGDEETMKLAYDSLDVICRIPTHLFQFVELCEKVNECNTTGWDLAHRTAICKWYEKYGREPGILAMHVTKYRHRHNWSHTDVLRRAHVEPVSIGVILVLEYILKGVEKARLFYASLEELPVDIRATMNFLTAVEAVRHLENNPTSVQQVCRAIRDHNLVREHVPTVLHNSVEVWKALLINMPFNALIRNLGKMASLDMLSANSEATDLVLTKLRCEQGLKYARIHPFNVLVAMLIYKGGHSKRGKHHWQPNPDITSALDDAFYMSIRYVKPTGKRFLIAIDVSNSMTSHVNGCGVLSARQAATALALVTASREQHCDIVGFSDTLVPIPINPEMRLADAIAVTSAINESGTDCARPILWAMNEKKTFDVFIICTDSETQSGHVPPAHALREYRLQTGISRAMLIVCSFTSNNFSVADPQDCDMLDMVGFDASGPEVINAFITASDRRQNIP